MCQTQGDGWGCPRDGGLEIGDSLYTDTTGYTDAMLCYMNRAPGVIDLSPLKDLVSPSLQVRLIGLEFAGLPSNVSKLVFAPRGKAHQAQGGEAGSDGADEMECVYHGESDGGESQAEDSEGEVHGEDEGSQRELWENLRHCAIVHLCIDAVQVSQGCEENQREFRNVASSDVLRWLPDSLTTLEVASPAWNFRVPTTSVLCRPSGNLQSLVLRNPIFVENHLGHTLPPGLRSLLLDCGRGYAINVEEANLRELQDFPFATFDVGGLPASLERFQFTSDPKTVSYWDDYKDFFDPAFLQMVGWPMPPPQPVPALYPRGVSLVGAFPAALHTLVLRANLVDLPVLPATLRRLSLTPADKMQADWELACVPAAVEHLILRGEAQPAGDLMHCTRLRILRTGRTVLIAHGTGVTVRPLLLAGGLTPEIGWMSVAPLLA